MIDTVTYDFVRPQSVFHVEKDVEETPWESTYKEETLYLWQTNEFVQYPVRSFMNQGKLLPEEFLEHNLCYGEWIYGQVYYQNYMEELGVRNPMRALLGRDETYYVAEDNDLDSVYVLDMYRHGKAGWMADVIVRLVIMVVVVFVVVSVGDMWKKRRGKPEDV